MIQTHICSIVLETSVTMRACCINIAVLIELLNILFSSLCFTYSKKREMFKERPAVVVDAVVL